MKFEVDVLGYRSKETYSFCGRKAILQPVNPPDAAVVFRSLAFLHQDQGVHPTLGEKVAYATVSPHLYILSHKQVQCYSLSLQLFAL